MKKYTGVGDTILTIEDEDDMNEDLFRSNSSYRDEEDFMNDLAISLSEQINMDQEEPPIDNDIETSKVGKRVSKRKVILISLSALLLISAIMIFTPLGKRIISNIVVEYVYNKFEYDNSGDKLNELGQNLGGKGDKDGSIATTAEVEDHFINILLVGVEEFNNASNTDAMIIASINTKDNSLKLISLMRDLYIDIKGYNNNRLNSVYSKGGVPLLYDTIDTTFGVKLDGYLLVNFEAFESIIDILDGIEVTLTKGEANYLNKENYISNPKNRNVVQGTQIMNGNQVMGYCRIRKVSTGTESNDFGRTQRQRMVLQSISQKLKSKNIAELVITLDKILSNVDITTDITKSELKSYLEIGMSLNFDAIDNLRIPTDGSFKNEKVMIGSLKQDVLILKNNETAQKEIYEFMNGIGN